MLALSVTCGAASRTHEYFHCKSHLFALTRLLLCVRCNSHACLQTRLIFCLVCLAGWLVRVRPTVPRRKCHLASRVCTGRTRHQAAPMCAQQLLQHCIVCIYGGHRSCARTRASRAHTTTQPCARERLRSRKKERKKNPVSRSLNTTDVRASVAVLQRMFDHFTGPGTGSLDNEVMQSRVIYPFVARSHHNFQRADA